MEFPNDLIHQLQTVFRKEAGISSYDPHDPTLGDLPSIQEAIEGLDPCPPYLRCKHCRGKLLRGLQSIVCIYCGAQQQREIPPDPIPFNSTFGYRWLLQSLDLDGSEAVEASGSSNGQPMSKDTTILSDLLNIELKWPVESEIVGTDVANNTPNLIKSPLNLAGVDLDNFFSETKNETTPSVSEQQLTPDKPVNVVEANPPGQGNLSLFGSTQSFEALARSTDAAADRPSSGWEAEFQSASPAGYKALDPFPDASPMDFSSPSETGFGFGTELKSDINGVDKNVKDNNPSVSQVSSSDNWNHADQWHTSITESSPKTTQFEMKSEATNDGERTDNSNNLSAMDTTLFQNDLWLPTTEKSKEDEEPFDDWQDFTSSVNSPGPIPSPSNQSSITKPSTDELVPHSNLGSLSNTFQEMEFGSFMAPDSFPESTSLHNGSASVHKEQENSYTDRLVDTKSNEESSNGNMDAAILSNSADNTVDSLMSQMNDLSFMLETKLSVPPQKEGDTTDFTI